MGERTDAELVVKIKFSTMVMAALATVTLAVGALQMAHIRLGIFTDQGADFFCPALLYIATRRNQTLLKRVWSKRPNPEQAAGLILGACYAWEFCQLHNFEGTPLVITRGTFDTLDLLSYTLGVAAAYIPDRFIHRASVEEFFKSRSG